MFEFMGNCHGFPGYVWATRSAGTAQTNETATIPGINEIAAFVQFYLSIYAVLPKNCVVSVNIVE